MISLFRVDHRLLHGQVALSWFNYVGANSIFICNDRVSSDNLAKTAFKMCKPSSSKLVIKNIKDSIDIINSDKLENYNVLILVENVKDAYNIIKESNIEFPFLNIGGTKKENDKKSVTNSIYLNKKEVMQIQEIKERGTCVYAQQIPNTDKVIL